MQIFNKVDDRLAIEIGVSFANNEPNIAITLTNFVSPCNLSSSFLAPLLPLSSTILFDSQFFNMLPYNYLGSRLGYIYERWCNKQDSNSMDSKLKYLNSVEATPISLDARNWKHLRQLSLIALCMI